MELGGKADIPSSTARQVSLQFSQRGFLPRRSYDSMPSKEVLMAENSIRPARWRGDPPVGPIDERGPSGHGRSQGKPAETFVRRNCAEGDRQQALRTAT